MRKTVKKVRVLMVMGLLLISSPSFTQQPVMTFDGINDYINLGNNVGNDLRTIEMWFMPNAPIDASISSIQTLIAREYSGSNVKDFNLSFINNGSNAGRLRFNIDELGVGNGAAVLSDASSWNANQWYHVAAVINPSSGLTLFIDGVQQANTNASHLTPTVTDFTKPTVIGHWGNDFSLNRYFYGQIDDVRISSNAVYTSNFSPPCPDLLATTTTLGLWNLNEGTGVSTVDASGNGNTGAINGATWSSAIICDSAACVCNAEFSLNNIGDPNILGIQTAILSINSNGVAVSSICIDLPYFKTLVDLDCIQCDPTKTHTYGTILGAQPIAGVSGVIEDPYGYGSGRKICYTFISPTVINTTVQFDLQFPPTLEIACCKNRVDFCLHAVLHTDPCTSCEYTVCPETSPVHQPSPNLFNENDKYTPIERIDEKSSFELSPNPASNKVKVTILDGEFRKGSILVTSSDGRKVLSGEVTSKQKTFDITDFESGSYFVTLVYNAKQSTQTLIIR